MFKKIITFVIIMSSLLFLGLPVFADDTVAHSVYSPESFWDYLAWEVYGAGSALQENVDGLAGWMLGRPFEIIGTSLSDSDNICPFGDGGYHHSSQYNSSLGTGQDEHGFYRLFQCDDCGATFKAYGDQYKDAYNDYVGTLPFEGYSSDGYYLWQSTISDIDYNTSQFGGRMNYRQKISGIPAFYPDESSTTNVDYFHVTAINDHRIYIEANNGTVIFLYIKAPVDGTYTLDDYVFNEYVLPSSGVRNASYRDSSCIGTYQRSKNKDLPLIRADWSEYSGKYNYIYYATYYNLPMYKVVPDTSTDSNGTSYSTFYAPTTRINNTSFNLATVENNEITKVYQNVSIINETNNTIYNPVTNETYEVNNWNYDYSTRTYEGTLSVDPEVTFELAYHDDKVVLKIGDLEFDLNYVVEEQPEPTPTPGPDDPTPTHTPLPTDVDYDTDDTPYWLWLMDWLDNFKAWLGDKLGSLGGGDLNITYNDNSSVLANVYEYEVTYENSEGEEESFSFKKLFGKFRWIKDVWTIGQELVSVVSSDAAYAYDFNVAALDYGQEAAIDSGEEQPIQDGNGELEDLETDGAGIMVGGAPSLTLNLGAAQSHYGFNYGGEVEFLDLSWYTPYKSTVDGILSGFLWIFFVWKLFQKAPGIISGAAMDSSKVEDIRSGERRR